MLRDAPFCGKITVHVGKEANKMRNFLHIKMTTTRIIVLGFLIGILLGTILLSLPIASKPGQEVSFTDAMFMATSSLCVTGLTTMVTVEQWSYFGQAVILVLMQFGGLGVITFTTTVLLLMGRHIGLRERMVIQDSYNLDSIAGVVRLTRRILLGTLVVEAFGCVLYACVFVPEYGFFEGMWKAMFHSVSAFCNAGLDIVGDSSFIVYQTNLMINITTMLLVVLGGLGFTVWWDVLKVTGRARRGEILWKDFFQKLSLHSKLVLTTSAILIFGGALLILVFEYNNPDTIGGLSFGNKVLSAFFESITLRSAGFKTFPQEHLTDASMVVSLIYMFIGGSPMGTAGGVKTITIVLLILSMLSAVRGIDEVQAFRRKISDNYVRRAVAVVVIFFLVLMAFTIVLSATEEAGFVDVLFESVAAATTAGISRGITKDLSMVGKWVVMLAMYLGRLGPITMALAFNAKSYEGKKSYAEGKVIIG